MNDWPFTVNSVQSRAAFFKIVDALWEAKKHITFSEPRIGPDRSLDQNALFQCWARECAAWINSKHSKDVTDEEHESIKRKMKSTFYSDTGSEWMLITLTDPFTGEQKPAWKSSKKYGRGQMFEFLTWMQMFWANLGLILESRGEFHKLQQRQAA